MTADNLSLPAGWEERFDETRNRKYWLWTLSNPPQKSYRHPLGNTTTSSDRTATTSSVDNTSSPLSSPMQDNSIINNSNMDTSGPSPATPDAPVYTEFSENTGNADHPESTESEEYQEIVSSPFSVSAFTDFSGSSEISPPPPTAAEFHAAAVRQQSFATSAVSGPHVVVSPPPPSRRVRPRTTLGLNGPRSLVNAASNSIRAIVSVSQMASPPTSTPNAIPTIAVKYRSGLFGSNSSASAPPLSTGVPNLYTQVQYHGPQVPNQDGNVNMPLPYAQQPQQPLSQVQQGPPPMMWRTDHPQVPNLAIVPTNQGQPQFQAQVSAHPVTPNDPSGTFVGNGAHMSTPSQPVTLGAMPKPGQPGYAGYAPTPSILSPPAGVPLQNQSQVQGQMSAQIQVPAQGQLQTNQQIPMQQSSQQPNVQPSSSQPVPLPQQQQQQQQNWPPYSPPPSGGIIPAPYNSSVSPSGSRPTQQRPNSGMPPHSKPLPGKFAPASYSAMQAQSAGAGRPPLQQQGAQVQVQAQQPPQQISGTGMPPQSGPLPGGYLPVSYASGQQQSLQVQQVGVPSQTRPSSGGYVPVPYNVPQIQQQHQPVQQASEPMHSSPPPRPTSHDSLQQPQQPMHAHAQVSAQAPVNSQTGLSQPSVAHPTSTFSPQFHPHASSPSPQLTSFPPNLQPTSLRPSPPQPHPQSQGPPAQTQQVQPQGFIPNQYVPTSYGATMTVTGTAQPAQPQTAAGQAPAQQQQPPQLHVHQQGHNVTNPPTISHQPSQNPHRHSYAVPHTKPYQPGPHHHHHQFHPQQSHPQQSHPQQQQQHIPASSSSTVPPNMSNTGAPQIQYAQVPYSSNVPTLPTNAQPPLQQNTSSVPYNSYVYPNYATGHVQNVPPQVVQQNMSQYQIQSGPQAAPQSQSQPQQGSGSQTQSGGGSKFTLSNITDAINLGVSAINLYENVDNAINPGSYPNASSNSGGGGGGVVVNLNVGSQAQGNGNGGNDQSSNSNTSGGSKLADANNLLNALNGAVSAFSSLNIGGGNAGGGNNLQNNNGSSSSGLNTGFNYNLGNNGDNMAAMNFSLGSGDGVDFGGGNYGIGTNFGGDNFGSGGF